MFLMALNTSKGL